MKKIFEGLILLTLFTLGLGIGILLPKSTGEGVVATTTTMTYTEGGQRVEIGSTRSTRGSCWNGRVWQIVYLGGRLYLGGGQGSQAVIPVFKGNTDQQLRCGEKPSPSQKPKKLQGWEDEYFW